MTVPALGAEFRRSLRLARSYWLEYFADLILYILGFLLLSAVFQAASPNYGRAGMLSTLIGYTTWKICASILEDIARVASDEARTGLSSSFSWLVCHPDCFLLGAAWDSYSAIPFVD